MFSPTLLTGLTDFQPLGTFYILGPQSNNKKVQLALRPRAARFGWCRMLPWQHSQPPEFALENIIFDVVRSGLCCECSIRHRVGISDEETFQACWGESSDEIRLLMNMVEQACASCTDELGLGLMRFQRGTWEFLHQAAVLSVVV